MRIKEQKVRIVLVVVVWLMMFSLRILNLDADSPNYGIGYYQQIDEGPYSYLALHQMNYGCINPDIEIEDINQYTSPHLRTNIIGNLFSIITFKLFGDNYYGMRMSSIFCMLINYILIFYILMKLCSKYSKNVEKDRIIMLVLFFILTLDFTFSLASRIVETSIYRMMFVLLGIVIFLSVKDSWKRYILLGFVSVFSVFGIYITNLFFVLACIGILFFESIFGDRKKQLRKWGGYAIGGGGALVLCECYMQLFWHTGIISNCLQIISNFSNVEGYVDTGASGRIYYLANFFSNSFHLYNPFLLFFSACIFPMLVHICIKRKDQNIIFLVLIYIFFFIQTMVSEDFIIRKYIIVVPIQIFLLYIIGINMKYYIKELQKSTIIFYFTYITACAIFTLSIFLYRFKLMPDSSTLDFTSIDKRILFVFGLCSVLVGVAYLLYKIFDNMYMFIWS